MEQYPKWNNIFSYWSLNFSFTKHREENKQKMGSYINIESNESLSYCNLMDTSVLTLYRFTQHILIKTLPEASLRLVANIAHDHSIIFYSD